MVSTKSIRRIGAASLIVPGLDHLIAPSMTMVFAPVVLESIYGPGFVAATVFFVSLGLFQLIWIGILLKIDNPILLIVGVLGNLVSILIYFVSTAGVTLPFDVLPQPLIAWAVLIKVLEAIFILASVYLIKVNHPRSDTS